MSPESSKGFESLEEGGATLAEASFGEVGNNDVATHIQDIIEQPRNNNHRNFAKAGERRENPERMEARAFFEKYLAKNVQTVKTLKEMDDIVREFKQCAPVMFVWKCVDGRVHGSKGKGYPTGTILFARTEGANIDIDSKNIRLWEIVNSVIADAKQRTPDMPAVVIILGHMAKSNPHRSCAAHGCDDHKALTTVEIQTRKLRDTYYNPNRLEPYKRNDVVFMHGMTNTDDMSETLIFENGREINSAEIIDDLGLTHPSDVFSDEFLNEPIQDPSTKKHIGDIPVRTLMDGNEAPIYRDLKTALAMEAFLLRRISEIVNKGGKGAEQILRKPLFEAIYKRLQAIQDVPASLKGPLMYQITWNIAYAMYQRNRLVGMDAKEQEQHLDHAEKLVCYGEGFETLARNEALLVKPGRGDEIQALTTAKNVLLKYSKYKNTPMVHINIELTDRVDSWDSYRLNVMAKLMRMKDNVSEIFGEKVNVMCTYSYKREKQFYPVRVSKNDHRECIERDMTDTFTSYRNFDSVNFSHQEFAFTRDMLRQVPASI